MTRLILLPLLAAGRLAAQSGVAEAAGEARDNVGHVAERYWDLLSPARVLTAIVVLLLLWGLGRGVAWAFGRTAERFPRQRLLIRRMQPLAAFALWAAGIYAIIFGVFDPGRDALLAIAGSAAVALGFGLQDVVRNVFGGLLVLMERPFQLDDRIRVGEAYGDVIRIGLRSVTIRTLDDSTVAIPNATFLSGRVSNTNTGALDCLVVCDTYLPARADTALAMRLAREAALSSRFLHTAKPVVVLAADHFDRQPALRIRVKAYVHDTRREMAFHTDLTRALREAYAAHGLLEERG